MVVFMFRQICQRFLGTCLRLLDWQVYIFSKILFSRTLEKTFNSTTSIKETCILCEVFELVYCRWESETKCYISCVNLCLQCVPLICQWLRMNLDINFFGNRSLYANVKLCRFLSLGYIPIKTCKGEFKASH